MRKAAISILVLGLLFAQSTISGRYFECYGDCHFPEITPWLVGCEVNSTEGGITQNLVKIGGAGRLNSHGFYSENGYREDIYCYYSVPIENVTGTEKRWEHRERKPGSQAVNATPQIPPLQPAQPGPVGWVPANGVPVNKVPKKILKIENKEVQNPAGGPPAAVPKSVTTPAHFRATHFTCDSDCPPSVDLKPLLRCSIIYNFREKGNIGWIVSAPRLAEAENKSIYKHSKVWSREEGGRWIYDEVLVCEYEDSEGTVTYTETQTPYDRLGLMGPPSEEDLERIARELEGKGRHEYTGEECGGNGVALPPGYAHSEMVVYAVNADELQWAERCMPFPREEHAMVRLLRMLDSSEIGNIAKGKTIEAAVGEKEWCLRFGDRLEEGNSGPCAGMPDAGIFITEGAMGRFESGEDPLTVFEEEWGAGIVYEPYGIFGGIEKLILDIGVWIGKLF